MDEVKQSELFAQFGWHLGCATGFIAQTLRNDELLTEFVSRDVKRSELERAFEALRDVAAVFYNEPKPA